MTSTIQLTINGNQVQGELDQIVEILSRISNTVTTPSVPTIEEEPEELLPFNEFAIKELAPHFGQQLSEEIVNKLRKCALSFYPDFRNFIGMYRKVGTIEQRQLLKTISAIYRFKFGKGNEQTKYSLKSEIKYATICPHCGAFANAFVLRLIQEGLWTV